MTGEILILDDLAEDYPTALVELGIPAADLLIATHPDSASRMNADVWLARPDFALDLLMAGAEVPRWIQSTWAGIAPLIEPCRRHDIALTTVKDIFGPQMSEYVFAYLLRVSQRQAEFAALSQKQHWQQLPPNRLQGKTLVILGTGSIGSHIAATGRHFAMTVFGVNNGNSANSVFDRIVQLQDLAEVLSQADFVVSTLPDTPDTRGLLDAHMLQHLKPSAYLVNVGRASVLDHNALAQLLSEGRVAGALLDVLPVEPLPASDLLWQVPGLEITPHIAAISYPEDVAKIFCANLSCYRQGLALEYEVDLDRGY